MTSIVILASFCCFVSAQNRDQLDYYRERIELGTSEVKRDALQSLRRLGTEQASRVAAKALNDPSEIVRATAISAVVFLPKSEASGILIPFLREKSPFLRKEAAHALAEVETPEAAPALIDVLTKDKRSEVRSAAAFALGKSGSLTAVPHLTEVLRRKPKKSRSFVRRSAARSIGQIAEAVTGREFMATTPENYLPEKYKTSVGARSTGIEFEQAAAVLENVLGNPKEAQDTRREAAFALGAIGNPASSSVLKRFASVEDSSLAEICREALLRLSQGR
ncbi:MAG: HEAT repeat domain-containing protein [Acidobacteriota bacterium]|nr:HEAT repeat domain-containing protein [Acidobacteriota bacterium]